MFYGACGFAAIGFRVMGLGFLEVLLYGCFKSTFTGCIRVLQRVFQVLLKELSLSYHNQETLSGLLSNQGEKV